MDEVTGSLRPEECRARQEGHGTRCADRALKTGRRSSGLEITPLSVTVFVAHYVRDAAAVEPRPAACDNTGIPRMPDLKALIREVPDFPKPGILFYDITTLLKDKDGFRGVIDGLKDHYRDTQVDVVLGIEARGFIFAPALAYALGAGFVPLKKPKKLPAEVVRVTYDLEYGTDTLEMHRSEEH